MPVLDHLILSINDREQSLRFYTQVLGFKDEGEREPFSILGEYDLPDVTVSDILAVLEYNRPGLLDFCYDAAAEAKVPRAVALDQCAAIHFTYCAGQVADGIADGDLDYLERPTQTGPT